MIEPNEQGTAGPVQMHPAWRALLQDIELMPRISASSRWRDLKQSLSMRTKRKAIAIIDRDHVLIRSGPLPRRMKFSEATPTWAANSPLTRVIAPNAASPATTDGNPVRSFVLK